VRIQNRAEDLAASANKRTFAAQMPYPVRWLADGQERFRMARNNYAFEKRQRDLAKKKKKEEKRLRKAATKDAATDEGNAATPNAPEA
jgi:hypothetical protein